MTIQESIGARSWLFAPGDSERKMEKAAAAETEKPKARSMVTAFLNAHPTERERLGVRINPLQGPHALKDLAAVDSAGPGGIMLPKARGRADVELLDHYLAALEVAGGIERGTIKVIALVTETAEAMFTTGSYAGAPRLVAMTWGAEDLADAVGASDNRDADGTYAFTYQLARSLCLLGASAAGVAAIETIQGDFRDEAGLRKRAAQVRRAGYRGMLAIHPAQVDIINQAFTPSAEEIASAQEIVDLFAANPGAATIGHKGAMLDRPYLSRAQALLALAAHR